MATKYVVHIQTESCDHYYVKIPEGETWPKRDEKKQLAMIYKYLPSLNDGETGGPGIAGSYLDVKAVIEV